MFKSLTKDLTGTADICNTVTDLRKCLANDYLLPGEQVLFSFQSAKEEFTFTNEAVFTIVGQNATTTRKLISRFPYREYVINTVQFETTGRVDRDCEIKFYLGKDQEISIDIAKKEEQAIKKYYKALLALQREQEQRRRNWNLAVDSLQRSSEALRLDGLRLDGDSASVDSALGPLARQASLSLSWLQRDYDSLHGRCYREAIVAALR